MRTLRPGCRPSADRADEHGVTRTDPTRPRVLLLTHRLPFPPDRGDRIRAYHLLRGLSERCEVTLASVCEQSPTFDHLQVLRAHAGDVLFQRVGPGSQRGRAACAMARGKAGTPAAHYHCGLAQRLIARHRERPFDTVVTFCTGMTGYAKALQNSGGETFRHVQDLVDVDSAKWARYARATPGPMRHIYALEARRLRTVERGELAPFDAISTISLREARLYQRTVTPQHKPIVAGNGVDTDYFSPGDEPQADAQTCVFTGVLSYKPNADAVAWFAHRVLPLVRERVPGARFNIVGRSPSPAVVALGQLPGVSVIGSVPDTRPYLRGAAVAVAPLTIAPGVQNKVLEAMACATPVVCSPQAARGIDALPGRDLLVASDAAAFADAVTALLIDPARAAAIGRDARQLVVDRYNWSAALAPLLDTIAPAPGISNVETLKPLKTQAIPTVRSRSARAA